MNLLIVPGVNDLETASPEIALQWHKTKNLPLRTSDVGRNSGVIVWWTCPLGHEYQSAVKDRGPRRNCPVCSNHQVLIGYNDLATTNPECLARWDWEKNGTSKPTDFTFGSEEIICWTCERGHSYSRTIAQETRGSACPLCIYKDLQSGVNDLATLRPDIAKEWDTKRNLHLKVNEVHPSSRKKAWWICGDGHKWEAPISYRCQRNYGCPICSNQAFQSGVNDLKSVNPDLAKEWDFAKNEPLKASDVQAGTSLKVWWRCGAGHSWKASVANRHRLGVGCPACAPSGFSVVQTGTLYFIENPALGAKKFGITNTFARTDRLRSFQNSGWQIIHTEVSNDGKLILDAETLILRWVRKDLGFPPFLSPEDMARTGGASETFSMEAISDLQGIAKMKDVIAELLELNKLDQAET